MGAERSGLFSCTAVAGAAFSLEGFGLYIYLGIHFRHSGVFVFATSVASDSANGQFGPQRPRAPGALSAVESEEANEWCSKLISGILGA